MSDLNEALQALRGQRHDVMNGLQVVRGYIQLNRPSDAIEAVDRLARWLQSLTRIQNLSASCCAWLLTASQSPHVVLTDAVGPDRLNAQDDVRLAMSWSWLEEQSAIVGIKEMRARVYGGQRETQASDGEATARIALVPTPAVRDWWTDAVRVSCPVAGAPVDMAQD